VTVAVRPTSVWTPVDAFRDFTRRFQNPTSPAKPITQAPAAIQFHGPGSTSSKAIPTIRNTV
jgi:hypothetical protein